MVHLIQFIDLFGVLEPKEGLTAMSVGVRDKVNCSLVPCNVSFSIQLTDV